MLEVLIYIAIESCITASLSESTKSDTVQASEAGKSLQVGLIACESVKSSETTEASKSTQALYAAKVDIKSCTDSGTTTGTTKATSST